MTSVSFVIPVFNKSRYLKYVVDSLKTQKGDFKKEFIFIDDGSTDSSYEILVKETKSLESCTIKKQENLEVLEGSVEDIDIVKSKCEKDTIKVVTMSDDERARWKKVTEYMYEKYDDMFSPGLLDSIKQAA